MDSLDPAQPVFLVANVAKGVAGQVDNPINRLFRQRAEKIGVIPVQAGLLNGFRGAEAQAAYTPVTDQPGLPEDRLNSPLICMLAKSPTRQLRTPVVEVIDDVAPRIDELIERVKGSNGSDGTALDTIPSWACVDAILLLGIATDVAVESAARTAYDKQFATIVVSDACRADSEEAHARVLDVLQKSVRRDSTADEGLAALKSTPPAFLAGANAP